MRVYILLIFIILVSCKGEEHTTEELPPTTYSSISLFAKQDSYGGYGGAVEVLKDEAIFTSNTNPKCTSKSHCRRVEMSKPVKLPVTFSYSFEILKWDVNEKPCGTHKGIPKGCYVIISQFWNQQAAPRAYVVLQKKPDGYFKLAFHNKNDEGKLDSLWETSLVEGVHSIEVFNDGLGASLTVNGETSSYIEMDVTSTYQDYLKWGMYWQKEMVGGIVIRFSDVYLDEGL